MNKLIFSLLFILLTSHWASEIESQMSKLDSIEMLIEQQKRIIKELEEDSSQVITEINHRQKKINTVQNYIKQIDRNILKLEKKMNRLSENTKEYEKYKKELQLKLSPLIPVYYRIYTQMENFKLTPDPLFVKNLTDLFYLKTIQALYTDKIKLYIDSIRMIDQHFMELMETKKATEELKSKQNTQYANLKKEKNALDNKLNTISENKDLQEKLYQQRLEDRNKILSWIKNFEQERKKQDDLEQILQYSFHQLKKKLPWPVIGKIIKKFGMEVDPAYHTQTFMNGIEIESSIGKNVLCIAPGIVRYADWHRSYGEFIIIEHSQGYYSIYGNLGKISVTKGSKIFKNEIIGQVGDIGYKEKNSLFFGLYLGEQPLNPIHWLK